MSKLHKALYVVFFLMLIPMAFPLYFFISSVFSGIHGLAVLAFPCLVLAVVYRSFRYKKSTH